MPGYFYHICLEVCRSAYPQSSEEFSLALESAWEALLPFQKQTRLSSSSLLSSTASEAQTAVTGEANNISFTEGPKNSSSPTTPHLRENGHSTYRLPTRCPSTDASVRDHPHTNSKLESDIRFGRISIECVDMVTPLGPGRSPQRGVTRPVTKDDNLVATGIGTDILGGLRTTGRYIPLDRKVGESIWGIVHLYRDSQETPLLGSNDDDYPYYLKGSAAAARHPGELSLDGTTTKTTPTRGGSGSADLATYPYPATPSSSTHDQSYEDCTTLCILAVPSYLSPSDFLGFVGEKTLDDVSHFRMIRTPRANRYMVLMKFRSAERAAEWQKEWNGKVFNSMEPETCHVVFVKSVEIRIAESGRPTTFSPAEPGTGQATLSTKPLAPPTPALIELPTCPVCLERMDETSGLLTIICQHVFHCTCLQKWKGSGCPVCRYTQADFRKGGGMITASDEEPHECSTCHSELNLWACLICGNIGCGRYDGAHAFEHWKETTHAFAMDLTSQRVWDYAGDAYVHRIIQSKSDGKLVELPAADDSALDPPDWSDAVPREKLENMSVEYTHLLTSQLESQRAYFEEIVERAADKASQAIAAAAAAEKAASTASARLAHLQSEYDVLSKDTVPSLERDRARLEKRAEKFESVARLMEKDYREEKTMNQSLMERVDLLTKENASLKAEVTDLAEQNRDLTFFISGTQRLQGQSEDIVQGTVSVPEPETKKKRNKGKGKR